MCLLMSVILALLTIAPLTAAVTTQLPSLSLAITREGPVVRIDFSGALQVAPAVTGPWNDLPAAVSPLQENATNAARFYRARAADPQSIFAESSVIAFGLSGGFQTNFEHAFAGTPDGIVPPHRVKEYFDGALQLGSSTIPVALRVRGNSSLQECPFPKLKFKVSKANRAGTPFFDAREIKVGTHCAEGGRGTIGRLRDERAAFREALAYEVMSALGFAGPRVRRAQIDYRDTSLTNSISPSGWQVNRHAVILDDIEVVAERLGGRALSDDEIAAIENANFDPQLIDLLLLHALLGNWDFALPADGHGLWNTHVIELPDLRLLPIAGDFDLSSFVTELVRSGAPGDYHPELGDVERQARFTVEGIAARVGSASFALGAARFAGKRAAIEAAIAAAEIDDAGRANAQRHTAAFFDALAAIPVKGPR